MYLPNLANTFRFSEVADRLGHPPNHIILPKQMDQIVVNGFRQRFERRSIFEEFAIPYPFP